MGSKPVDKSQDLSIRTPQTTTVRNPDEKDSADRFEEARMAFFSK
jgi:hypothetical protein